MIALNREMRAKLAVTIEQRGVVHVRSLLKCDEQTMMRAALGVPLRDDVAERIAEIVGEWE